MSDGDLYLGAMVLLAADHWRAAPWHERLVVWALGRRERFTHLNARLTVAWWRGRPYWFPFGRRADVALGRS